MGDEITTVLRLVSEGKLSPEEAAPIIEALGRPAAPPPQPDARTPDAAPWTPPSTRRCSMSTG